MSGTKSLCEAGQKDLPALGGLGTGIYAECCPNLALLGFVCMLRNAGRHRAHEV